MGLTLGVNMEKRRRLSLKTRHGVEDSNKRRNVECQCSVSQEQLYTNENNMDTMLFKASKDSGIQGDTMTPKREECKLVE